VVTDDSSLFFKVWVDISGARKKMKLNRGKYQQLTGDSSLDERTLHGIQTGILTLPSAYRYMYLIRLISILFRLCFIEY